MHIDCKGFDVNQNFFKCFKIQKQSTLLSFYFASISNRQRNIGCGPSQSYPLRLPDPLEIWVSTYQRLREEDTKLSERITEKKNGILNRHQRRRLVPSARS